MAGESADQILGIRGFTDAVEIGRGGFGIVYRAHQPALARDVAVKVLSAAPEAGRSSRFDRERQSLGALSAHPAVVTVYESGFTDSGRPYLVMELMAGGSLAERVADSGPLPWPEAVATGVRIAGGLEAAHRLGVLHRDVKPDNLLVSGYGDVRLADFGIAALVEGTTSRTSNVTASVAHAAPEVLEGKPPNAQSDVYGLSSTVFSLLYGRAAFRRSTDESVLPMMTRIFTEQVPDLRELGVPDAVCAALERGMAKDPAQRYATAAELGEALQAAQAASGEAVTPMLVDPTTEAPPVEAAFLGSVLPAAMIDADAGVTLPAEVEPRADAADIPTDAVEPVDNVVPISSVDTGGDGSDGPRRSRRALVAVAIVAVVALLGTAVAFAVGGGGDDGDASGRLALETRRDRKKTSSSSTTTTTTTKPAAVAPAPPAAALPDTGSNSSGSNGGGSNSSGSNTVTPAPQPAPTPAPAPAPAPIPAPTASISGPSNVCANQTSYWYAHVTNATRGNWSLPHFNLGVTTWPASVSQYASPSNSAIGGTYTWSLTVYNSAGKSVTATKSFYVAAC